MAPTRHAVMHLQADSTHGLCIALLLSLLVAQWCSARSGGCALWFCRNYELVD